MEHRELSIVIFSLERSAVIEKNISNICKIRPKRIQTLFHPLKISDLQENFVVPPAYDNTHAALLVHPPGLARNSLTDVPDSLYDNFLRILNQKYGRDSLCILSYGITNLSEATRSWHLQSLYETSPTLKKLVSDVILSSDLQEMSPTEIQQFRNFIISCSSRYEAETGVTLSEENFIDEGLTDESAQQGESVKNKVKVVNVRTQESERAAATSAASKNVKGAENEHITPDASKKWMSRLQETFSFSKQSKMSEGESDSKKIVWFLDQLLQSSRENGEILNDIRNELRISNAKKNLFE